MRFFSQSQKSPPPPKSISHSPKNHTAGKKRDIFSHLSPQVPPNRCPHSGWIQGNAPFKIHCSALRGRVPQQRGQWLSFSTEDQEVDSNRSEGLFPEVTGSASAAWSTTTWLRLLGTVKTVPVAHEEAVSCLGTEVLPGSWKSSYVRGTQHMVQEKLLIEDDSHPPLELETVKIKLGRKA